mmetsp:Transcript_35860/g.44499  ORF Transcript_35860/g.44499 Transcript_35860/m.44499 type:complete len:419 (+) Transcript_35860:185-1441(+)
MRRKAFPQDGRYDDCLVIRFRGRRLSPLVVVTTVTMVCVFSCNLYIYMLHLNCSTNKVNELSSFSKTKSSTPPQELARPTGIIDTRMDSISTLEKSLNNIQLHGSGHNVIDRDKRSVDTRLRVDLSSSSSSNSNLNGNSDNSIKIAEVKLEDNYDPEIPPMDWGNSTHAGPSGRKVQPMWGIDGPIYYNDEFKFAYLHLFKNGGTAIRENLDNILCELKGLDPASNCGPNVRLKRGDCFGDFGNCANRIDYFTFSFSRNPWDRAVSMWSYGLKRKQKRARNEQEKQKMKENYCSFEQMVHNAHAYLATKTMSVSKYWKTESECGGHFGDTQWRPSWNEKGSPMNFIGRLEYFDRDWRTVLARIDPSGRMLEIDKKRSFKKANKSPHKKYMSYYTPELKKLITEAFIHDVNNLGYTFEH